MIEFESLMLLPIFRLLILNKIITNNQITFRSSVIITKQNKTKINQFQLNSFISLKKIEIRESGKTRISINNIEYRMRRKIVKF